MLFDAIAQSENIVLRFHLVAEVIKFSKFPEVRYIKSIERYYS